MSSELVHVEGGAVGRHVTQEVIRPLSAESVLGAMAEHQTLLQQLLDPSDWQGRPGADGSFVKKSGWRKIAVAYNITLEQVKPDVVERSDSDPEWPDKPMRATATWRAVGMNGRAFEAAGHCAWQESRFSGSRGNQQKLENDMRATAETRAKNRAISDLVGMGKVSAEEAEAGGGDTTTVEPFGPRASDALETSAVRALALLLDHGNGADDELAQTALAAIVADCGDYLPRPVARAIALTGKALMDALEPGDVKPQPAPGAAAPEPPEYGEPRDQPAQEAVPASSAPSEASASETPPDVLARAAGLCGQPYKGSATVLCVKPEGHDGPHQAAGESQWEGDGSDSTAGRSIVERAEKAAAEQTASPPGTPPEEQIAGTADSFAPVSGEVLPPEDEPSEAELAEAREAAGQDKLDVGDKATDDIAF